MNRLFLRILPMILCLVLSWIIAGAESATLYPARDANDLWGYIDETGSWVIEPQYESAGHFVGDYAIVSPSEADPYQMQGTADLSVINLQGEPVLQHLWGIDHVSSGYSSELDYWIYGYEGDDEGYFIPTGCFDWQTGKVVELNADDPYQFEFEIDRTGTIVPVSSKADDTIGFYDLEQKKLLFEPQFNLEFYDIASGLRSWDDYNIVRDCSSNNVVNILLSSDGTATVLPDTLQIAGGSIAIDDYWFSSICGLTALTADDKYILMDYDLQPIIGPLLHYSENNDFATVTLDGHLYQNITSDGTVLSEEEYTYFDEWIEGYASVQTEDGGSFLIRQDGTCAVNLPESCFGIDRGNNITVYHTSSLSKQFLFDRQHETIKEIDAEVFIEFFMDQDVMLFSVYYDEDTPLYGIMDTDGHIIQEPVYSVYNSYDDSIVFTNGMLPVLYDGKCGYLNASGELAIPCQYTDAEPFRGQLAKVVLETEDTYLEQYIDHNGQVIYSVEY